jgi:pimeloyl-ACP methyl ester carboxylesterase
VLPHQVVTGTGHWIQLERVAAVNRVMDEFLAGLDEEMDGER